MPRQFQRLIETALPQAQRMQGHGDDAIGPGIAARGEPVGEQLAQQPGVAQPAVEFQTANQIIQRRSVAERHECPAEGFRVSEAAPANSGLACRQGGGASRTGPVVRRQVGRAGGAQVAVVRPGGPAQQADGG